MRKFLLSLFVFGLSLTAAVASKNVNQKHFVSVMAEEDPCKMESVKYWKITDFPFLNLIQTKNLTLIPDQVRWPTGTIQVLPDMICNGAVPTTINVEVLRAGVTDLPGQGAGMACVIHLGKVTVFGSTDCDITPTFNCVQNIQMNYSVEVAGGYELYTADLPANLPPGTYELTCACTDQGGPILNPVTHPGTKWIGDEACPGVNTFVNHRLTVTGAVPNDDCSGTLVELMDGPNPVDNLCSTDGLVGFFYEIQEGDIVDVVVTPGTVTSPSLPNVRITDPCTGMNVSLPLTCRTPGEIIYIQAGNGGACPQYGTFTITVTDIDNGVGNDVCIDADALNNFGGNNILNCGETGGFTGDTDACPDPEALACFGTTTEGVWYSFTTATSLTTFSVTATGGGQYQLFSGANCGALTSLGCAVTNLPSDPLTTYFLLVGPTGTVNVTAAALPLNDACAGAMAFPVVAGNNPGLTNECATTDLVTCGAESEATVWYSYVLGANDDEVVITSDLPNSVVRVYTACAGVLVPDADGVDCNATATLQCRVPGTYFIQVGSSFVNAGPFALNITATPNGVVNDACSEAVNIPVVNDCTFQPFNTNSTNACPETFSLACNGGNNNADPTVWLQFTPPVGVTSINIQNITPGAYLSILTPCGAGATIPGGGCLFGPGPTANINVTGGTTYFIAAAIAGGEGMIDFEIKYNDPPANDICSAAIPVVTGANANLTNVCAQQELTPCGGTNDQASVWYSYDIPAGVESLVINSSLAGSVVQIYEDDCNTILTGISDACSNTVTIDCPEMQSIRIYVSSSSATTGIFTLTLTQTLQSGIDVCPTGQPLALTQPLCKSPNVFMSDNTGFCPEPAAINFGGCDFSDGPATWYRFTTSATTTLIDIDVLGLNVDFALFTNCVSGPVASSCTTDGSLADLPVTGSTTYNLVISGQGGAEGPFTIEITEKSNAPLNDICTSAFPVNLGSNANLTNLCANEEQTPCVAPANEASVWYLYTIPTGVESLTITTDLVGGVLYVVENDCNTLLNGVTGSCTSTLTIDCPVAQDIRIFMSSSVANSGTFTLTLNQTNTSALNDLCADAEDIADNPICEFFPVPQTTTVGACPEQFTVAGCAFDYSAESVVWYEFTPPVGVSSIEIENISANTNLTVFTSCPNPNPGTILAGGGCLSGNGTNGTPILVTAGVTYYIAIGVSGTEGPVDFDIRYNQTLANDDPCVGGFIPTPLTTGVQLTNQNNVCATDDNDCGGAPVENTLWYTFTLGAGFDRITINVTGLTSPSIAVYDVANPCNQTAVNEECNGDGMADFNCLPAGTYTIMIGTSAANAGVFSITATQGTNAGPANDFCTNATNLPGQPYDLCVELGPFDASTVNACPETLPAGEIFGACNFNVEETSWYVFTAPGMAGDMPTMDFTYTSYTGTGTPFMNLFEFGPDCSALNAVETTCFQGLNTAFGNIGPLTPGQQYLIAISSIGDTGGDFEFTVKFNLGPANDDKCADLTNFDLGSGGTLLGQTNLCSGADYIIPDCPAADAQNSVWYT
ncbi:MAG TPA: hypothetical protein PKD51_16655, partial [Saprospiraceae bacterium]|nr:hypothetical protein [Saprospiraceae bacterium]